MSSSLRPALLLDRDGVINVDRGFVSRREDFEWMPGIFDVTRTAARLGMTLVVVTNQSGIGRGYYTEHDYQSVTAYMRERFAAEGTPLAAIYHCPFHPEAHEPRYRAADHPWRKPRAGMLLAARDDLGLDLARSAMLGDRLVDLQAGAAAGVGTLGLVASSGQKATEAPPHAVFRDLSAVPEWLEALALPASALTGRACSGAR
jgi:D-glycero-D-manno-heptose 1,7-bisphosphate phosphatase